MFDADLKIAPLIRLPLYWCFQL